MLSRAIVNNEEYGIIDRPISAKSILYKIKDFEIKLTQLKQGMDSMEGDFGNFRTNIGWQMLKAEHERLSKEMDKLLDTLYVQVERL